MRGRQARGTEIGYFTWWNIPRRAWYLILGELGVILFLALSLVLQYFYNVYFQGYVNQLLPILVPILSVAFGATSATVATRLYLNMRKIHVVPEVRDEPISKKKTQPRKTAKRSPPADLPPAEGPITTARGKTASVAASKPVPLPNLEDEEKARRATPAKPAAVVRK